MQKMNAVDFNYHLKSVKSDTNSFNILYEYSTAIIREHLIYKFGKKAFDSFLYEVPHDVFTKIIYEKQPENIQLSPSGYLCRSAYNYVLAMYKSKDNRMEKLNEDVAYVPDYSDRLEFSSPEIWRAWNGLDGMQKYILYLNLIEGYRLKEIASVMALTPACVRAKKCRAVKELKRAVKNSNNIILQKGEV